ncbi:hypothetical protein PG993_013324 [Apiospora rasikravindrae]|uniref:Uncharacterized protein n=1 Tax=Apiospora rasikravindrae TaxID=990691 RepID=A0ABR1RXB8_9PEZI
MDEDDKIQLPKSIPRQTGQNYLELLVNTDFTDVQDLVFAHAVRKHYEYQEIILYEHTVEAKPGKKQKDSFTNRYFVVMDHNARNHLGSSYRPSDDHTGDNADIDIDRPKQLFESMVMALEVTAPPQKKARSSKSSSRSSDQTPTIPRFVIEIGEIKVETWRPGPDGRFECDEVRHIGCHMVMDIETPFNERALWLVHRHRGVEDGVHLKKQRKWDRDDDLFTFLGFNKWDNVTERIPVDFDVAQLAARAEDWYHRGRDCAAIQNMPELMRNTALRGNCRLQPAVGLFEEFKAKVNKED